VRAPSAIAAGPFTELVVFGDSLSDVGNIRSATFGFQPGPFYHMGRFSNGSVFVEALSMGLGLGPSVRSTNGGDNFAYGGARTAGTLPEDGGSFIRDINEQVDSYLPRATDPDALFLIFAGANDLLNSPDVNAPVDNLEVEMNRLIADGARNFIVLNLPWLGLTPRFRGTPDVELFNTRTRNFNAELASMLTSLELDNPATDIYQFDVAALFNDAVAHPQWFGLANVTHAGAPGLEPGDFSYDTGDIAPNVHQYLFWDELHPTETVHAILAERVQMHLATPGDFNRDNTTDAADYVAWRKRVGSVFTPPDLATWMASFGEAAGTGGPASGATVPEPSLGTWAAICVMFALGSRSRYNKASRNFRGA
jgi:phospholipase/lecithinase/hemolysin